MKLLILLISLVTSKTVIGQAVVATYTSDWSETNNTDVNSSWKYYWNAPDGWTDGADMGDAGIDDTTGEIGEPANYVLLKAQDRNDGNQFYTITGTSNLLEGGAGSLRAVLDKGLYGIGTGVGGESVADRFCVIAYTVSEAGHYAISNSSFHTKSENSGGVEFYINVNDAPALLHTNKQLANFDLYLGQLSIDDVVYVCVGPNLSLAYDFSYIDFSLQRGDQSMDTGLTSDAYVVDEKDKTISDIPDETTLETFKSGFNPTIGATFEVYTSDGSTIATDLKTGYQLIVTAEDGNTQMTYTLLVTSKTAIGQAVVATYTSDWSETNNTDVNSSWKYYWNAPDGWTDGADMGDAGIDDTTGEIGEPANYVLLKAQDRNDGNQFYTIAGTSNLSDGGAGIIRAVFDKGLYGIGTGLGGHSVADRFCVIAYTVSEAGHYAIANSSFHTKSENSGGVEFYINVNDAPALLRTTKPLANFDLYLGQLSIDDVVYVCVGPNLNPAYDLSYIDFSLQRGDQSMDTGLTSDTYVVDEKDKTISDIPEGTTLETFKSGFTPAVGATFKVYTSDGSTIATDLQAGYQLIVTAEDGNTQTTYSIVMGSAPFYILFPHLDWEGQVDFSQVRADQAGYYDVEMALDGDFDNYFIKDKIEATVSRYVPNKPLPAGQWSWRYRYVNHAGNVGEWETQTFERKDIPEENVVNINAQMNFEEIRSTISDAFSDAVAEDKPVLVRFEAATYHLTATTETFIDLNRWDEDNEGKLQTPPAFIVDGQGAEIIIDGNARFAYLVQAANVEIMNFEVDYKQASLNGTSGQITAINTGERYVDVAFPDNNGLSDAAFQKILDAYDKGWFIDQYSKSRKGDLVVSYESYVEISEDNYRFFFSEGRAIASLTEIEVGDYYFIHVSRERVFYEVRYADNTALYNVISYWTRNAAILLRNSNRMKAIDLRFIRKHGRLIACNNDGGLQGNGDSPFDLILHWFDNVTFTGAGDDLIHVGNGIEPVVRNSMLANSRRMAGGLHANGGLYANNVIHNYGNIGANFNTSNVAYRPGSNTLFINNELHNAGHAHTSYYPNEDAMVHDNIAFVNNTFYRSTDYNNSPRVFEASHVDRVQFVDNTIYLCNDNSSETESFCHVTKCNSPIISGNRFIVTAVKSNPIYTAEGSVTGLQVGNNTVTAGECYADTDGDGVPNDVEGTDDIDDDGVPNYLDDDSDGNDIIDLLERYIDQDGDGIPDYLDADNLAVAVMSDEDVFRVYPNPVGNTDITIELAKGTTYANIKIYNVLGGLVYNKEHNNTADVRVSSKIFKGNGLYIVSVQTASQHLTKKLIVNK